MSIREIICITVAVVCSIAAAFLFTDDVFPQESPYLYLQELSPEEAAVLGSDYLLFEPDEAELFEGEQNFDDDSIPVVEVDEFGLVEYDF